MLIHGKLFLTASGFCLDEVKSLLQKALRRKDVDLVTRAAKELVGRGKDQLQWKSLVTYLFEDHCLSDAGATQGLYKCYVERNKYKAVELLLQCYTCRLAACLPVVALDPEYNPVWWDPTVQVDPELQGLVSKQVGNINFDLLLHYTKSAWLNPDEKQLVFCAKLASMVHDHEKRAVTKKGEKYLMLDPLTLRAKKFHTCLVLLSVLYKCTEDLDLKKYLSYAFKLSLVPEAPVRLIISSVVTYRLQHSHVKPLTAKDSCKVNWREVPKLDTMPLWATDKHTFRGKCGKGTRHLLKKDALNLLSEAELEEFHGERPKVGVHHFFDEGCQCKKELLRDNPYWERTKEIYLAKPPKLQKTTRMTAVYYKEILKSFPGLQYRSPVPTGDDQRQGADTEVRGKEDTSSGTNPGEGTGKQKPRKPSLASRPVVSSSRKTGPGSVSRKRDYEHMSGKGEESQEQGSSGPVKGTKQRKLAHVGGSAKAHCKNSHNSGSSSSKTRTLIGSKEGHPDPELSSAKLHSGADGCDPVLNEVESKEVPVILGTVVPAEKDLEGGPRLHGPLLQLPTGQGKVYTRLDSQAGKVWKGPYKSISISAEFVMFAHHAMRKVIRDPHTLPATQHGRFVQFPLLKDPSSSGKIHVKDFYDCIGKKQVARGEFVSREALGIIQVHNLPAHRIRQLPMSFWAHFVFRFALNIGDSGLYNTITDSGLSFLYGIDLEAVRHNVRGNDLLNLMFVMLPKKELQVAITHSIRTKRAELLDIVDKDLSLDALVDLSQQYGIQFDQQLFTDRLAQAKKALSRL